MSLIPLAWKLGAAALLLTLVAGGYLAWTYHQREIGRQEIIAKDAKAVADQAVKDRALSETLVVDLQTKLSAREATAAPVRERIIRVGTECSKATGPDAAAAAGWVSDALSQTGGPATGRKPAP